MRKTYIYLMKDLRNQFIKIGFSNNPTYREKTLQSEQPLIELLKAWEGTRDDEKRLHKIFASKRVRGEWFSINKKDIDEIEKRFESRNQFNNLNNLFVDKDGFIVWEFSKPINLPISLLLGLASYRCFLLIKDNLCVGVKAEKEMLKKIHSFIIEWASSSNSYKENKISFENNAFEFKQILEQI